MFPRLWIQYINFKYLIINLAVIEILYMRLKDVETASLFEDLDSNNYVKIPEGFILPEAKSNGTYSIQLRC